MNNINSFLLKNRLLIATLIRFLFSFYELHSDLDYEVFTDAAKYYSEGGSPYDRETFRYTPLVAYLALPNLNIDRRFCRFLFSLVDVAVGLAVEILLCLQRSQKFAFSSNSFSYYSLFYLFNPYCILIASRGSFDCLVALLVLLTLILIETRHHSAAALCYGLALHFKIYPVIMILALYLYISRRDGNKRLFSCGTLFNLNSLKFAFLSVGVFLALLVYFYGLYGEVFLYEYLLYHVVRKDHRYNFSMYFYSIYLTYQSEVSSVISLVAFVPQALLVGLASVLLYSDINLALVAVTKVFVNFNKVSTAQYRVWYMSLIPLILPQNQLLEGKKTRTLKLAALLWIIEGLTFFFSLQTEMQGENWFFELWITTSLLFFLDCLCLKYLLKHYNQPKKIKVE